MNVQHDDKISAVILFFFILLLVGILSFVKRGCTVVKYEHCILRYNFFKHFQ